MCSLMFVTRLDLFARPAVPKAGYPHEMGRTLTSTYNPTFVTSIVRPEAVKPENLQYLLIA